jgi:putative sterol carrier protein
LLREQSKENWDDFGQGDLGEMSGLLLGLFAVLRSL